MDEEDQDKVQWMRSVYREVLLDSPVLKRVKASDVHRQLKLRYAVQCSHNREASLTSFRGHSRMSRAKLQVSHEPLEQVPDVYAFFVRLAWGCKDSCSSG